MYSGFSVLLEGKGQQRKIRNSFLKIELKDLENYEFIHIEKIRQHVLEKTPRLWLHKEITGGFNQPTQFNPKVEMRLFQQK